MIDIENEIVDYITDALTKEFPNVTVYGDSALVPSSFPCVTIEEADNYSYEKTQDSGSLENHAVLMYEINVYSNRAGSKKSECKKIFAFVDSLFQKIGFTRTTQSRISINTATDYRLLGRYRAVAGKNKMIYGG